MKNPNKRSRKEVHSAQDIDPELDPKRLSKEQKKKYVGSGKSGKLAEGKKNFHHAKRASPKDVTFETEPEYPNKEGKKWDTVIKQQSVEKGKRLDNKLKRKK